MTQRGFTYLELIMSLTLLAVLSAALVPTTQKMVKRQKETELRRTLLQMRTAIDRFKKAHEEGIISVRDVQQQGYPKDLDELVEGVPLADTSGGTLRFLRKIPVDPITGEAEWGMRSTQDEPDDSSWGRENLFDVYSLSDGVALDGTEYSEW